MAFVTTANVTLFAIIPSTILTIILNFIVLKSSPRAMKHYKYVIMLVSLSIYQFDLVDSVLLCPSNLEGIPGFQYFGILSSRFPRMGNEFTLLYISSLIIGGICFTFSFVWREYSLIPFVYSTKNIVFCVIHFIIVVSALSGVFPMFGRTVYEYDWEHRCSFMNVSTNRAIWIICWDKMNAFAQFGIYTALAAFCVLSYVVKAIYRIKVSIGKLHLSPATVRMHKMLLRSLIFQLTAPMIFFLVPLSIAVLFCFIPIPLYSFVTPEEAAKLAAQVTAVLLIIPSFFSTLHVITVIYFTTPYRIYVLKVTGWGTYKISRPVSENAPVSTSVVN